MKDMKFTMLTMIGKQLKIFRSIIISYTVDMMDNLFFSKITSYYFLYNKTASKNISTFSRKRMCRFTNKNIAMMVLRFSARPSRVILTSKIRIFLALIPCNLQSFFAFIPRNNPHFRTSYRAIHACFEPIFWKIENFITLLAFNIFSGFSHIRSIPYFNTEIKECLKWA